MAIVLGANQYGKAEIRFLHVRRDGDQPAPDAITDLNVSVTLAGELTATHLSGDNSAVLTTDAQKNTVYAFAQEHGVGAIEDFALLLARHFVASQAAISFARVTVEQYPWERLDGHAFVRSGREIRTATVSHDGTDSWVVSGLRDLTVLKSAGSEFWGFARDRYTTLAETSDRILATAVEARWRHARPEAAGGEPGWAESYGAAREAMLAAFAGTHSYSLQQTLFAMGQRVLAARPEIAEIRLALPNKHHFDVDMSPFGLPSSGEVFYVSDRPYGLIEGTIPRDDAPPPWTACQRGAGRRAGPPRRLPDLRPAHRRARPFAARPGDGRPDHRIPADPQPRHVRRQPRRGLPGRGLPPGPAGHRGGRAGRVRPGRPADPGGGFLPGPQAQHAGGGRADHRGACPAP